ncbi:helix-turn-helix domain-containing protein [Spirillospora sp. CA-128828]|uniref:helix-turn-helix domain-containing protein n=1 Tax=Spirillospora sp. CA-128828 TaxID=3240033 RepID=UPI003D921EFF
MHTWLPHQFRAVLKQLREQAGLSDADLARLAGKSRSQVNRWSRAENQPNYDGLRSLVENLTEEGYPTEIVDLASDLLRAAGYGTDTAEPPPAPDAEGAVRLTVIVNPEEPEPDYPPGGLRSQAERIIWAMVDEPWQVRLAQILAGREAEALSKVRTIDQAK